MATQKIQVSYKINPKVNYNPNPNTAQGNSTSWGIVQTMLANGAKTQAVLQAGLAKRNHTPFIGYAIRRGWLVTA